MRRLKMRHPKAIGYRIVLEMLPQPEEEMADKELAKTSIIIPEAVQDNYKAVPGCELAKVLEIGPETFPERKDGAQPWCKVGDEIFIKRFSGMALQVDGIRYRIINEEDIAAVIEDSKDE